jgi:hypothetical protein
MKLTTPNAKIDYSLCKLLGEKPSDFIVLCLDGVAMEDFGTPYDTRQNRIQRQTVVRALNDRSADSLWPEFFDSWKANLCKQFGLPPQTEAKDFRPKVSLEISRVCPAFSEHLFVAVRLFETLSDRISLWSVRRGAETTAPKLRSSSPNAFS